MQFNLKLYLFLSILIIKLNFSISSQINSEENEYGDHNHGHLDEDEHGHHRKDTEDIASKPLEKMTPNERRFYQFKLNDMDNDDKIDGNELVYMIHKFAYERYEQKKNQLMEKHTNAASDEEFKIKMEELDDTIADETIVVKVDALLKQHDRNNDGYIAYGEYIKSVPAA